MVALPARRAGAVLVTGLVAAGAARAQCDPVWLPGAGVAGVFGVVYATAEWDPDGAGPASPVIVVGGWFPSAGDRAAASVATYDPQSGEWAALGGGVDGIVYDLDVSPTWGLVAVGTFQNADGAPASRVARWDGAAWQPLGAGLGAPARAVASLANGDLVVGGEFAFVGGASTGFLARWDGVAWSPFAGGVDNTVMALQVMPNGDLVAAGYFTAAGGTPASRVARWNGSAWSPLGAGVDGVVLGLGATPGGEIIVGGQFLHAGGATAQRLARWDGASWSTWGIGADNFVQAIQVLPNGDLVVGGAFTTIGGTPLARVARWDGVAWSNLGSGVPGGYVFAVQPLGGAELLAAGDYSSVGGVDVESMARWNGAQWSGVAEEPGQPRRFARGPDGGALAVGNFRDAAGHVVNTIGRWQGDRFVAAAPGLGFTTGNGAECVVQLANGDVVVGGKFSSAGGVAVNNLARWDGAAWHPLGVGVSQTVYDLLELPNGDLVVAWANGVSRWNGSSWVWMSGINFGSSDRVSTLARLPDGSIVAAGRFFFPGSSNIVRWNGAAWQGMGGGVVGEVFASCVLRDGTLVIGGSFNWPGGAGGGVQRWTGAGWSQLAGGVGGVGSIVYGLSLLPDGDLLVTGLFTQAGGGTANAIARFDGSAWSSFGGGLTGAFQNGQVFGRSAARRRDGTVVVCGAFLAAGADLSLGFAQLAPTCPASSASSGPGCVAGGACVLTATELPWLGGAYVAEATGLPVDGLALSVYGFATTSVPLSSLLPQGTAGCSLLTLAHAVDALVSGSGRVTTSLPVPNAPALIDAIVHHQVLPVELDANGAIVEVTASNRLTLTVGDF